MKSTRTLRLRREALADLSPNELAGGAAGEEQVTGGVGCVIIASMLITCLPTLSCFSCPCQQTG